MLDINLRQKPLIVPLAGAENGYLELVLLENLLDVSPACLHAAGRLPIRTPAAIPFASPFSRLPPAHPNAGCPPRPPLLSSGRLPLHTDQGRGYVIKEMEVLELKWNWRRIWK